MTAQLLIGVPLWFGQAGEAFVHPMSLLFDDAADSQDHLGQGANLVGVFCYQSRVFGDLRIMTLHRGSELHLARGEELQLAFDALESLSAGACLRLNTSPSQVVRLLEEDRASKQLLQLFQLAQVAGYEIKFNLRKKHAA